MNKTDVISTQGFVVDKDSMAMKFISRNELLEMFLYEEDSVRSLEQSRAGMPISKFIAKCVRDQGKTVRLTWEIEAFGYAVYNLLAWKRYQMTYSIKESTLLQFLRSYPINKPDMKTLSLPFPAVFVVLNLDRSKQEESEIGYLICKRENRFDVTAFVGNEMYYYPVDSETFGCWLNNRISIHIPDSKQRDYMKYAWQIVLFLAIYNREPEIIPVSRIILKGQNGTRVKPSDYVVGDFVSSEKVIQTTTIEDRISAPGSALSTEGLIPPCERPIEIVMQKGTHKSPRPHDVAKHYRTYWTGKGRTKPIRKEIESFSRGGKPGDKITPRAKVYE